MIDESTRRAFFEAFDRHHEPVGDAYVAGRAGKPAGQGPYMEVMLLSDDGVTIRDAKYRTYGCPACIACGSAVCEIAKGRCLAEARGLTANDLVPRVGKLPTAKRHCYGLAIGALNDALDKLERGVRGGGEG